MKVRLAIPLDIEEIAQILKCRILGSTSKIVRGAVTSGLEAEEGSLYFALTGKNGHGVEYWRQAVSNGAVGVVTDALPVECK